MLDAKMLKLIEEAYKPDVFNHESYLMLAKSKSRTPMLDGKLRVMCAMHAYLFKLWFRSNLSLAHQRIRGTMKQNYLTVEDAMQAGKRQLKLEKRHLAKMEEHLYQHYVMLSDDIKNIFEPVLKRYARLRLNMESNRFNRQLNVLKSYWESTFKTAIEQAESLHTSFDAYLKKMDNWLNLQHTANAKNDLDALLKSFRRTQENRLRAIKERYLQGSQHMHQCKSMMVKQLNIALGGLNNVAKTYETLIDMAEKEHGYNTLITVGPSVIPCVLQSLQAVDEGLVGLVNEAFPSTGKCILHEQNIGDRKINALMLLIERKIKPIMYQCDNLLLRASAHNGRMLETAQNIQNRLS